MYPPHDTVVLLSASNQTTEIQTLVMTHKKWWLIL